MSASVYKSCPPGRKTGCSDKGSVPIDSLWLSRFALPPSTRRDLIRTDESARQ